LPDACAFRIDHRRLTRIRTKRGRDVDLHFAVTAVSTE
jgi:hypothetical protein